MREVSVSYVLNGRYGETPLSSSDIRYHNELRTVLLQLHAASRQEHFVLHARTDSTVRNNVLGTSSRIHLLS